MSVAQCCKNGEVKVAARYWVVNGYTSSGDCMKSNLLGSILDDFGQAAATAAAAAIAGGSSSSAAVGSAIQGVVGGSLAGIVAYLIWEIASLDIKCNATLCDPPGWVAPPSWND